MRREQAILSNAFRYFAATAAAGSIRGAARDLNVASSAVNRQILMLEDTLGLALFERTGRRLIITEPGEILLKTVDASLADYELALQAIEGLKGLTTGRIEVASVESVSVSLLPRILAGFRAKHPGVTARVTVTDANAVTNIVSARKADLGITFNPISLTGLEVAFRRTLAVGAVVGAHHPLSANATVKLDDCFRYPVAYPSEGLSLRKVLDDAGKTGRLAQSAALEANSLRLMASLARDGDYVAFQTRIGIEEDLASRRLVFIPLDEPDLPPDDLMLVRQKSRTPSPAAAAMFREAAAALAAALDHPATY